jgi:ABC-type antimicrobial peptide transport system permease subunit
MRLFGLLGLGLGVLLAILVGATLFKLQAWMGLDDQYPLLSLLTLAVAVYSGYRFYFWFVAWNGG